MHDDAEGEMVEQARRGDVAAAEALFERYFPLLRMRVRRKLPPRLRRKVAESDIIQDAYLGALQRLSDFEDRGKGSFGAWLATIVDRRIADQVRRFMGADKRNVNREITAGDSPVVARRPADISSVSSEPRRLEATEAVLRAVDTLSHGHRMVLRLVHHEGQTMAEAAELMGISPDAARRRYGRALVSLQKAMRAHSGGGGTA